MLQWISSNKIQINHPMKQWMDFWHRPKSPAIKMNIIIPDTHTLVHTCAHRYMRHTFTACIHKHLVSYQRCSDTCFHFTLQPLVLYPRHSGTSVSLHCSCRCIPFPLSLYCLIPHFLVCLPHLYLP